VLTQEADSLGPSLLTLVATGTAGDDKIIFNPGGGQAGSVTSGATRLSNSRMSG
jgi:hypothetical protein